ncbi:MAG: DUF1501 domain-containing protein [Blastocatellia bacterium]|nr:DUF1501 domain-containing protein [Blastocatellia bacterium]
MPTTRRQFIKLGAGMVTVGVVMPRLLLTEARAQSAGERKILVVIQTSGGIDGLNLVVPYTDARYYSLRPTLSFQESELKDSQGNSTVISNEFGLHPSMSAMKNFYDAGKLALVLGVGYPDPNLSHFLSKDIWHTADLTGLEGEGWLGKYADLALVGQPGLPAVSIGSTLPKSLFADDFVTPSISNFQNYTYQTDNRHSGDRNNQLNTFNTNYGRSFPEGSFISGITSTGLDALKGAEQIQESVGSYTPSVDYPAQNRLAAGLQMIAQVATTIPEANLFYVEMGGFDHHSNEIGNDANPQDKSVGQLAALLGEFSQAVNAFYEDMAGHGLAENLLMFQWSEFGRRPNENNSFGTDHGTAEALMVIGDPVKGGLYGEQPSLAALDLDNAGNMVFNVDFREVYATILDGWLDVDSNEVLGAQYPNVGFLG